MGNICGCALRETTLIDEMVYRFEIRIVVLSCILFLVSGPLLCKGPLNLVQNEGRILTNGGLKIRNQYTQKITSTRPNQAGRARMQHL